MSLRHARPAAVLPLLFTLFAPALLAADKLDLDRITPVPATAPIPIMDFFRPRLLQEPKINLAGTHVAAIISASDDHHQLLVDDLATQKLERVAAGGDRDIYSFTWLDSRRLVFSVSSRKLYGLGLLAADVGSIDKPFPLLQYYGSTLIAVPPKDRLHPLVWNRSDIERQRDQGVAVVASSVKTGSFIDLTASNADWSAAMDARDSNERHIIDRFPLPPSGITYHYLADLDGKLAYAFTADAGALTLFRLADGGWIKCPVDLEHIDVLGCGRAPGELVVLGPRQEGKPRALQLMNAVTGKLGEVIIQDHEYDFSGWLYRSPATQDLLGVMFERNGPRTAWFSEDYRKLQKVFDGFFPGLVVRIIGSDEAQKTFLVATFSDRQPTVYNLVDLEKRSAGLFKNSEPWIDPQRMRPMIPLKFKTRDGRHLDAYLTLPAGASKKNPPPLVVLPHGGPWVRDNWGFDGEVQFLASRGYAVLQPNYRGSTGYDWMFPDGDRWDFRKMHDDVTDATKAMIASGLVDPKRVGIMGGSFGGYLAVSGVVNEPSLYRCAVAVAGVFDWARQIQDEKYDQYDSPVYGRMMRMLGSPKEFPERFDAISPGRHVDRIKVPVFVAGGGDDHTVDIEQSKTLIDALEKHRVPHESLIVRSEGHGMSRLADQVELYGRIEVFLAKNLMEAR